MRNVLSFKLKSLKQVFSAFNLVFNKIACISYHLHYSMENSYLEIRLRCRILLAYYKTTFLLKYLSSKCKENVIIKVVKRKWKFCQLSSRRVNKTRSKFLSISVLKEFSSPFLNLSLFALFVLSFSNFSFSTVLCFYLPLLHPFRFQHFCLSILFSSLNDFVFLFSVSFSTLLFIN